MECSSKAEFRKILTLKETTKYGSLYLSRFHNRHSESTMFCTSVTNILTNNTFTHGTVVVTCDSGFLD
jgi:hypothetical protein